jgi:hypothetical protein
MLRFLEGWLGGRQQPAEACNASLTFEHFYKAGFVIRTSLLRRSKNVGFHCYTFWRSGVKKRNLAMLLALQV